MTFKARNGIDVNAGKFHVTKDGDATARQFNQIVNVKAFGAVGDSVTNDSDAISRAAEFCLTNGGILFFPRGDYYFPDYTIPPTIAQLYETGGLVQSNRSFLKLGTMKPNNPKEGTAFWDNEKHALMVFDGTSWVTFLKASGDNTVKGDMTIDGNLTVTGTTSVVDTEHLHISDSFVKVNSNTTGLPTVSGGIEVERGDMPNAKLLFDEVDDTWKLDDGNGETAKILSSNSADVSALMSTKKEVDDAKGTLGSLKERFDNIEKAVNRQEFVSTANQAVFTLSNGSYVVGSKTLKVYLEGVLQPPSAFTEVSPTSFQFNDPVPAGLTVVAEWLEGKVPVVFGHKSSHEKGGQDEIDITKLKGYDENVGSNKKKTSSWVDVKTDFGAIGDGVADDTVAIQNAASSLTNGGTLYFPAGNYKISNTILLNKGIVVLGAGLHLTSFTMSDSTKFALNLFVRSSTTEYFEVKGITINAKYGIVTRYPLGSDYASTANPSRSVRVYDCKLVGSYDPTTDSNAQSLTVPTRAELEGLGVGISLVMSYGAEIKGCLFDNYGIALQNMGGTMTKVERNRFHFNARHIHDERTLWATSSFGMGADNVYELNDCLDATRIGGITLFNSFNVELRHNYTEHLERNGVLSAPEMIYCYNTDACKIHFGHNNINLAVTKQRPFIKMLFDGNYIGRASGNIVNFNTPTPFNGVLDNIIEVTTNKLDYRYPYNVQVTFHELYPFKRIPYVLFGTQPELNVFEFDNLFPQMKLSGTVTTNLSLPFTKNTSNNGWYLTPTTSNLRFNLFVKNQKLTNSFQLQILAEGNPTTDGGNGRCWVTVRDQSGTVLYNDNAVTAVTSLVTKTVNMTVTTVDSLQKFDIDLTNLNFSKIYRVAVVPN